MLKKILHKILNKIRYTMLWGQIHKSQDTLLKKFIYDETFTAKMSYHDYHSCISKWIKPKPGKNEKIIEIGCGPGKYVAMLSTLGFQVVGVDPLNFTTWDIIKEKTSAQLIDSVHAENLPFPDQYFDHAVCLGALLYFDDPVKALHEIYRVLKPGGRVIIKTVNKNNLFTRRTGKPLDPATKNLYTIEELEQLIRDSGLVVVKSFTYFFVPPICPNLWWYLTCVWIPLPLHDVLSAMTRYENRSAITVFAESPGRR
ncbi:class I SAM-dependent methyltransferase [Candidatus Magnetominusculus xianensis]|uniref:Ubiquinone biosynthesis protein UbiE n=1 Tax=Candidatus Magnetominusculus xianensis TaxID=1748249 RepID=A0ABR5SIQ1_9BACT|nr:class I SAM-dependent methyltransferase [Candidatus Magnetominusculus xianensis]KWT91561.1 ubiquinone biosynthesis protein UbiE [Candidatus Magnetominusculus xianensis]MBF0404347.1 class I SAM-dependent methyltransferase [Nitrospirota bacterium]